MVFAGAIAVAGIETRQVIGALHPAPGVFSPGAEPFCGPGVWDSSASDGGSAPPVVLVAGSSGQLGVPSGAHAALTSTVIGFSGCLHDRAGLWRALPQAITGGQTNAFHALSDRDLALCAVQAWGDDAATALTGDFVLVAWDRARRHLLLACDPSGSRPVFYAADGTVPGGGLLFATALPVLRRLVMAARGGHALPADDAVLARILGFHWPTDGRTAIQGLRQLPPGGRLRWEGGGIRVDRPRQIDWTHRLSYRRDEDYVDAGRAVLDQVVGDCLSSVARSGGRVGAHLTAGLDSSGIAATAVRLQGGSPLDVLTIVPDAAAVAAHPAIAQGGDEWAGVQPVLKRYPSLQPHRIESTVPPGVEIRPLTATGGMPVRLWFGFLWHQSQEATVSRLGLTDILGGAGGNLTLSWAGPLYPRDCLRRGAVLSLWQYASAEARRTPGSTLWKVLRTQAVWPLLPSPLKRLWHRLTGKSRPDYRPAISATYPDTPAVRGDFIGQFSWQRDRGATVRRGLVEEALWRRSSGAAFLPQCTIHEPLWAFPLLEFSMAVPDRQYGLDGARSLARRVLADRLPQEMLATPSSYRQGADWYHHLTPRRDQMAEMMERFSRSDRASALLDLPRLRKILDAWPTDEAAVRKTPDLAALSLALGVGDYILWTEHPNL